MIEDPKEKYFRKYPNILGCYTPATHSIWVNWAGIKKERPDEWIRYGAGICAHELTHMFNHLRGQSPTSCSANELYYDELLAFKVGNAVMRLLGIVPTWDVEDGVIACFTIAISKHKRKAGISGAVKLRSGRGRYARRAV